LPKGEKAKPKSGAKASKAPQGKSEEKPVDKPKPLPRTEKTEEELVDLTSRVYKLVVERGKDGVLQSEIWKELGLTSRDGSRLAIRLEKRGMIRRVKLLDGVRPMHRVPRRVQVLRDDRHQPTHLPAHRALGNQGVRRLQDD
jgi:hypothetical protein